jgi:hypothetical protein
LLYAIAGDSFRIFNIANINSPYRVGASNDVGYYLSMAGNYAYVSDRWGLYIIDIQNPANPYRVNSWGSAVLSAQTRDTFCYVSTYDPMNPDWLRFTILNVANPNSIQEESHIDYAGGYDVYLLSYFAYVSGYYLPVGEFQIIDISNPSLPSVVSRCTTAGWNNGVWVNNPFGKAFVADDWEGLQIINISNPTSPYIDTTLLGADNAMDVFIDNNYAYIADLRSGLKIIEVSNPALPFQVGEYDTSGQFYDIYSAAARDSFAYIGFAQFRVISVSNPSLPFLAGSTPMFNDAEDMLIRDSLVYVAEDYKFEIFNVSNPRQPRLVGSCSSLDMTGGLFIKDTFAFVAAGAFGLGIINIANPTNPYLVSTTSGHPTNSWGVAVRDTFAYIPSAYDSLWVLSVANPSSVYSITSVWLGNHHGYDVVLSGQYAYVGCYDFRVFDISTPTQPRLVGYYTTPDRVRRIFADSGYIYAACFAGGMCIFEQLPSGIEENNRTINAKNIMLKIYPNPAKGVIRVRSPLSVKEIKIFDVSGKLVKVTDKVTSAQSHKQEVKISLKGINPGIYFLQVGKEFKKFLVVK